MVKCQYFYREGTQSPPGWNGGSHNTYPPYYIAIFIIFSHLIPLKGQKLTFFGRNLIFYLTLFLVGENNEAISGIRLMNRF